MTTQWGDISHLKRWCYYPERTKPNRNIPALSRRNVFCSGSVSFAHNFLRSREEFLISGKIPATSKKPNKNFAISWNNSLPSIFIILLWSKGVQKNGVFMPMTKGMLMLREASWETQSWRLDQTRLFYKNATCFPVWSRSEAWSCSNRFPERFVLREPSTHQHTLCPDGRRGWPYFPKRHMNVAHAWGFQW